VHCIVQGGMRGGRAVVVVRTVDGDGDGDGDGMILSMVRSREMGAAYHAGTR
jgi:hypothetical protein